MIDLILGDCLDVMPTMVEGSVHCCVTSPPYFGLRDYGADGQIGLEATPDAFVAKMVDVFREVRRVLRDDGTLWLNLGDSYASGIKGSGGTGKGTLHEATGTVRQQHFEPRKLACGLATKQLLGIPWRVAFALQADGWYLRSDIIWHKPNPMPESVRDRPTKSHEYLFLLTKSERYHYDADAVREAQSDGSKKRWGERAGSRINPRSSAPDRRDYAPANGENSMGCHPLGRNRRSVFSVETVHAKLRSDLSQQQKSYIIGELIQRGLL